MGQLLALSLPLEVFRLLVLNNRTNPFLGKIFQRANQSAALSISDITNGMTTNVTQYGAIAFPDRRIRFQRTADTHAGVTVIHPDLTSEYTASGYADNGDVMIFGVNCKITITFAD